MFGMMVFWLLVPVGIAWWMIEQGRTRPTTGDGAPNPLRILEERLARGEIDAEEFRARREAIQASAGEGERS